MWLPLVYPPTGNLAHTPACALDQESNRQPFDSQACTQPLSHTSQGKNGFYMFANKYFVTQENFNACEKFLLEHNHAHLVTYCLCFQTVLSELTESS